MSMIRALLLVVACLIGCGAYNVEAESLGEVKAGLGSDTTLYANTALTSPWQNWGWSSTAVFNNTTAPLLSGSTSHIRMIPTAAWGAISLAHPSATYVVNDYASVTFDVRSPTGTTLYVNLENSSGASGVAVAVSVTTAWVKKTVPVASLKGSLTSFMRVDFMGPAANQTFYIDNVQLKASSPPSPTYPSNPMAVTYNNVVSVNAGQYFVYIPSAYDASHNTPSKLLVWMHGCGGNANGDAWVVSPGGAQSYVTLSVGGRDGTCWFPNTDTPLVLNALADMKTRLNIDPKRVVVGGYSSGGDMAYRTIFYNAGLFAGVIAENTSPFRDTGSTQAQSLAAAAWKFNAAHLAHLSDANYLIAAVRAETDAMTAAAHPMTRVERPGTHWDPDTANSGTNYDLRTYLLPYLNAGWVAP